MFVAVGPRDESFWWKRPKTKKNTARKYTVYCCCQCIGVGGPENAIIRRLTVLLYTIPTSQFELCWVLCVYVFQPTDRLWLWSTVSDFITNDRIRMWLILVWSNKFPNTFLIALIYLCCLSLPSCCLALSLSSRAFTFGIQTALFRNIQWNLAI